MRNLKKVIALVAVFAMLVSTVAFATTFSDVKDDDNYAEAIEMLSNLGILTGDDQDGDGVMDFRPNDTITRAEVAAIVCRVQNLNNLAQTGTQFTDVTSSHWASGYVAQAAGKGIINGNGDGTFAPEANVKFQDVVKMFVRTLGYEPYVTANGGYPSGDLAAANRYGVLDGVIQSGNEAEATRGQVAQIAFNALDTPLMDRSTYGANEEWVIYNGKNDNDFQSLLTQYLGVKKIEGTVEGTQVTGLKSANSIDTNDDAEITFAYDGKGESYSDYTLYEVADVKKVYEADSNASQYLGYSVNAYVKETGKSGEYDIISIAPSNKNKVASFTLDQFASATDKKIEYYKNDNDNNTTSLTLDGNILSTTEANANKGIIYNGVAYNGSKTSIEDILTELKVTKDTVYSGKVTLIDNDTTNGYDVIIVEVGAPAVVDEVKSSGKVAFKEVPKNSIGNKIELTFDEDETDTVINLTKDGKKIEYTDLKEWDVLSILFNNDSTKYYDVRVVDGNKVDGAISSRKASTTSADGFEYTIAGNSYDVAANCYDAKAVNKGWTVGTAGMFYVDEYGKIVAFDKNGSTTMSSTSGNYAYVLYAVDTQDDFDNKTVRVQILDKDGKVYTADLASKVRLENYDGNEDKTYDMKETGLTANLAKAMMNQLITYEANSSGEIKTVTFPTIKGDDSSFDRAGYGDASYDEDDRTIKDIGSGSFDVNDDTVVFFVKADGTSKLTGLGDTNKASKSASKVGTVASIADGTYKMAVYDEDNGIAGAIVLFNTTGGISASSNIAVIDSVGEATVDSNDVLLVKYFMNGEEKESYTDEDLDSSVITKNTARGTVYKFSLSSDGSTITDAEQLATLSRENNANKGLVVNVFDKTKFDTAVDGGVKSVDTKEVMYAGPVYDYASSSKRIRIATEKTAGFDFTNTVSIKAANANVYVIDPNKKNNKLYVGDASDVDYDDELTSRANDVLDGKNTSTITVDSKADAVKAAEQGLGLMDYAFAVEYDGDILDVVIYKAYDFKWSVKTVD